MEEGEPDATAQHGHRNGTVLQAGRPQLHRFILINTVRCDDLARQSGGAEERRAEDQHAVDQRRRRADRLE